MTVQEEYFKNLSEILKKNFKKKGFAFNSFSNKEDAKKFVLSKIKKDDIITFGGSASVNQTGILEDLKGYKNFVDRNNKELKTDAEKEKGEHRKRGALVLGEFDVRHGLASEHQAAIGRKKHAVLKKRQDFVFKKRLDFGIVAFLELGKDGRELRLKDLGAHDAAVAHVGAEKGFGAGSGIGGAVELFEAGLLQNARGHFLRLRKAGGLGHGQQFLNADRGIEQRLNRGGHDVDPGFFIIVRTRPSGSEGRFQVRRP